MTALTDRRFGRRDFLKGGGALIILGGTMPVGLNLTSLAAKLPRSATRATDVYRPLDPNLLSSWLAIKADGTVVARSGHVDLGQGNQTALAQIIAEELDVEFGAVSMIMGNTNQTLDQGVTAGSTTILLAGAELRQIAAEGRQALLRLASERLHVPASRLTVKDGVVHNGSKHIAYAELVRGQVLTASPPMKVEGYGTFGMSIVGSAKPKPPSQYTIVGKSIPRVDIPGKVMATATYVQDVKVAGMLHARVVHPPAIGATVLSVGRFSPAVAGARSVRVGNLVAVVAEREWDAIQGLNALEVRWSSWNKLPPSDGVYATLRTLRAPTSVQLKRGDAATALGAATKRLRATYQTPFENHGMLGPSCAVADVRADGSATIYSATQYPQGLQQAMAAQLGVATDRVEVLWFDGPGCYGRLSSNYDDAASEATALSKKLGRPIRVQWMRPDEHIWEPHGPGTVHDLSAGLDAKGHITAWTHDAWMPSNSDSTLLGAILTGKSVPGSSTGVGGWTGPDLYTFPNALEVAHDLPELAASETPYKIGLRTTYLRSPGQYQITYAQEAFVNEVAAAAGTDALAFRLQHLTDPRAIAVLRAAAKLAGWSSRPSPQKSAGTKGTHRGRGIALVQRGGTYCAGVASVTVKDGEVHVDTISVAQDQGLIINPRAIEKQIQSAVLQTVSRSLLEQVTFDDRNVTSTDWITYPILAMAQAPSVQSVLIDHPTIPSTGVGEPAVNLVAPAICGAIFDATGKWIRTLPLRISAPSVGLKVPYPANT